MTAASAACLLCNFEHAAIENSATNEETCDFAGISVLLEREPFRRTSCLFGTENTRTKQFGPAFGARTRPLLSRDGGSDEKLVDLRAPDRFRTIAVFGKNCPQRLIQESTITKE
jgi:hypothetical protein